MALEILAAKSFMDSPLDCLQSLSFRCASSTEVSGMNLSAMNFRKLSIEFVFDSRKAVKASPLNLLFK